MARLETRRYDGKLDSFLHRNLAREDYERVCTSEPCVVVSPDEKRVHKHVILGHRCLYFADFPPKTIKVAMQLKDIQSIRMVGGLNSHCPDPSLPPSFSPFLIAKVG